MPIFSGRFVIEKCGEKDFRLRDVAANHQEVKAVGLLKPPLKKAPREIFEYAQPGEDLFDAVPLSVSGRCPSVNTYGLPDSDEAVEIESFAPLTS